CRRCGIDCSIIRASGGESDGVLFAVFYLTGNKRTAFVTPVGIRYFLADGVKVRPLIRLNAADEHVEITLVLLCRPCPGRQRQGDNRKRESVSFHRGSSFQKVAPMIQPGTNHCKRPAKVTERLE